MARILVVEDDLNNFELLRWDLEELQHDLSHATNACDAIVLAAGDDYDLILMDITIPYRDDQPHNHQPHGLRASTEIRGRGRSTPIVAITAHGMEDMKRQVLAAGCNEILEKPFDFDQLVDCLDRWLPARPR